MLNKISLFLIPFIFKTVFLLITFTCRIRIHGQKNLDELKTIKQPWIYSTWHNNVATGAWAIRNQNIGIMISDSKDGEYITRCVNAFGNFGVRGSTSSGSTKAARGVLKAVRNGYSVAVTPDGPRGPKYKLQQGVLWLSVLAKAPILPYHIECSKQWVFRKSWDDHKIPKPFSTIHVCIGEPIWIEKQQVDKQLERTQQQVQMLMMQNVNFAEKLAKQKS